MEDLKLRESSCHEAFIVKLRQLMPNISSFAKEKLFYFVFELLPAKTNEIFTLWIYFLEELMEGYSKKAQFSSFINNWVNHCELTNLLQFTTGKKLILLTIQLKWHTGPLSSEVFERLFTLYDAKNLELKLLFARRVFPVLSCKMEELEFDMLAFSKVSSLISNSDD